MPGLPRYQVKEQQETCNSCQKSSEMYRLTQGLHKPLYLSKGSQPCQCSTCVGAMATFITPVIYKLLWLELNSIKFYILSLMGSSYNNNNVLSVIH